MIGAGTIINPIIKVVTTVAILGAIYVFFVKPTLETTQNISDRAFDVSDRAFESGSSISESINKDVRRSLRQAQKASNVAIPQGALESQATAQKLLACIQQANQDVNAITACNERFSP